VDVAARHPSPRTQVAKERRYAAQDSDLGVSAERSLRRHPLFVIERTRELEHVLAGQLGEAVDGWMLDGHPADQVPDRELQSMHRLRFGGCTPLLQIAKENRLHERFDDAALGRPQVWTWRTTDATSVIQQIVQQADRRGEGVHPKPVVFQ
jgi:hypothetical protein